MPCSNGSGRSLYPGSIGARGLRKMLRLLPILVFAACSQQGGYGPGGRVEIGADGWRKPLHYYPPPGPPGDPWGPYIHEAAARYRVPEQWVRAVMQQESGGEQQATSPVGAMGLMQVMPATYDDLRVRHRLGDDPYEPHNNVLAGTAYIREMYDRYGAPGFLAGYNAGPDRVDRYLAGKSDLPDETVHYLAAITPNLGTGVARSGPFAVYASNRTGRAAKYAPTIASLAAGCDLNAAYNPNHPCTTLMRAATQPAPVQTAMVPQLGAGGCDLNAAFDPNHPCTALTQQAAATSPAPVQRVAAAPEVKLASIACNSDAVDEPDTACAGATVNTVQARSHPVAATPAALFHGTVRPPASRFSAASGKSHSPPPSSGGGGWAIQVGAFANPGLARAVADGAREQAPHQLRSAALVLQPTEPFGHKVLYRARFTNLSEGAASNACARLNHRQLPCVVVRPTGA